MRLGQGVLPKGSEKSPEILSPLDMTSPEAGLALRNK